METMQNSDIQSFDLNVIVVDRIRICEIVYRIAIIDLADLLALNSVIGAFARGVIDYAEREGFFN